LDESRLQGTLPATSEKLNPITIVAWVLGFAVGYFLKIGIPSLNSLMTSGIAYYVGMKLFGAAIDRKREQSQDSINLGI
jgi:cytosine permease